MSGPPPPPPPPMQMPSVQHGNGGPNDRSALLKSIHKGVKLKKTSTNDKSAPAIEGKVRNSSEGQREAYVKSPTMPSHGGGLNLGELFAGGVPKLRSTGKLSVMTEKNPSSNVNSHNEMRRHGMHDNKHRGPPPPAPMLTHAMQDVNIESPNKSSNGLLATPSSALSISSPQLSILKSSSSSSGTNDGVENRQQPRIPNHGKPNLAPKPPQLQVKPAAPLKKLSLLSLPNANGCIDAGMPRQCRQISRTQSMRSPSSCSDFLLMDGRGGEMSNTGSKSPVRLFGTVRSIPNGRPTAPPPSIPTTIGKFGSMGTPLRPPNHAPPPPPPPAQTPVKIPNQTPAERSLSATTPSSSLANLYINRPASSPADIQNRTVNTLNKSSLYNGNGSAGVGISTNNVAPPPPPRNSSITASNNNSRKNVCNLEEKFKHMFHHISTFPSPPPFRNVTKLYTPSNRQVSSKQPAPQPPHHSATP